MGHHNGSTNESIPVPGIPKTPLFAVTDFMTRPGTINSLMRNAHPPAARKWLLAILLLALVLRIGAAFLLQYLLDHRWNREFLIEGDAEGYWILAQKIVAGEDYSIYTPPRYALRMPGFPALLAIPVWLFGPNLFAARLFLAGVDTAACWLVYRLGRQMFNERIGLIASFLGAISPAMIGFFSTILSETAFSVTLLWSLLAGDALRTSLETKAASVWRAATLWKSCWLGVALAAGVMMRPSWILAGPVVAVLLWLTCTRRWSGLTAGCTATVVMVMLLLPWGIRNQQVTGHFTLTTFWMGPSLYDGLNPEATGDSNMKFYDRDKLMETMGEYEVDQHYRKAAWSYLAENPGRGVELAGNKLLRYWSPWPNAAQFGAFWMRGGLALYTIPLFLLALWGTFRLVRRSGEISGFRGADGLSWKIWSIGILAGPVLYFAVIHMFFVSSLRYRLPAEYPLLILAAIGLAHWTIRDKST